MSLVLRTHNIKGVGTFGELTYKGEHLAYSVEREWLDNRQSVSCIPAGTYKLHFVKSPRFGRRLALTNEALNVSHHGDTHRTYILIHPANYPTELQGCLAFGDSWSSKWGVSNSRLAVEDIEDLVETEDLDEITIIRSE